MSDEDGNNSCRQNLKLKHLSVLLPLSVFIIVFLTHGIFATSVFASTETISTRANFDAGYYEGTEGKSKEGELRLKAKGSWVPRSWRSPNLPLNDQSAIVSDGKYIYLLLGTDNEFYRYIPSENRWQALANAPHTAYQGADLVVIGNYVYASFGGFQKAFSRYSIQENTWTDLATTPELMSTGSSLVANAGGTIIYALKGGTNTDFWAYDIVSGEWDTKETTPLTVGAGGTLVESGGNLYTPRGAATNTFLKYEVSSGLWSTFPGPTGITFNSTNNATVVDGAIYLTRGSNTTSFYRYNIEGGTWDTLPTTPFGTQYAGVVYNAYDDYIYIFRGAGTYDIWKYNYSGSGLYAGPMNLHFSPNTSTDLQYYNGNLYAQIGNSNAMYQYNLAAGTWNTLTSDTAPAIFVNNAGNNDNRGIVAGTSVYYFQGYNTQGFWKFSPDLVAGSRWTTLPNISVTVQQGASMTSLSIGETPYIYTTRGGLSNKFYRFNVQTNVWDDAGAADIPNNAEPYTGSRLVSDGTNIYLLTGSYTNMLMKFNPSIGTGGTWTYLGPLPFASYYGTEAEMQNGKIYVQAGYSKGDFWEYSESAGWRRLADQSLTYPYNLGPYQGGSLTSIGAGTFYSIRGTMINGTADTQMQIYAVGDSDYVASGTWTSNTIDLGTVSAWDATESLSLSKTTPGDSTITVRSRTSADNLTWSSWASVISGSIPSPVNRYIQLEFTLNATSGTGANQSPILHSASINYTGDQANPSNPSTVSAASQSSGGVPLTSGNTYKYPNPYFSWSGASDPGGTIAGYYVYFGTSLTGNPQTEGNYQTASTYTVTAPLTNSESYYLRLETLDSAGRTSGGTTAFIYGYNGPSAADPVTSTETSDFESGTLVGTTAVGGQLKLQGKAGYWEQEKLSLAPATVSYGSAITYDSTNGRLYVLRGNSSALFAYDLLTDTWSLKQGTGIGANYVVDGGDMCEGDSDSLYAFRGANTNTFWRYDISEDQWYTAANALSTVYRDSALVYDGSRYIYAIRGNSVTSNGDFYRYDTGEMDNWEALDSVNFGGVNDQQDSNVYLGADLAYGAGKVYAIQGSNGSPNYRSGFAVYDTNSSSWSQLTNLPVSPYQGAQIEYDSGTNAIYYLTGNGKPYLYKYDITGETWEKLPDGPATFDYGTTMKNVNGVLYVIRGNTTSMYKYDISKASWLIPNRGFFGDVYRGTTYLSFTTGSDIIKGSGNEYYMTRGGLDNRFFKYNLVTGEKVQLADMLISPYTGAELVHAGNKNKIYATANSYQSNLFVYDIPSDSWSTTGDSTPYDSAAGTALAYDGSRYMYWTRGGDTRMYQYDTEGVAGSRWTLMATNAIATFGAGGDILYKNGYIYALRGGTTLSFYRFSPPALVGGTGLWSDTAVADLPAGATIGADGFLMDGGSDSNGNYIYACRAINLPFCYKYTIGSDSWSAITNAPAAIGAGGAGASDGVSKFLMTSGAGATAPFTTYGNGIYNYVMQTDSTSFLTSGTYTSETYDLSSIYKFSGLSISSSTASNTTLTPYTRTSADNETWDAWTTATEDKIIGSSHTYRIASDPQRYLQMRLNYTSDGVYSDVVNDYSINYYKDILAPTNPTTSLGYSTSAKTTPIYSGTWYAHNSPYIEWLAAEAEGGATDGADGSGVNGYYIYAGTDPTGDPISLGTYSTNPYVTLSSLVSGTEYYVRVMTKDNADNISSGTWTSFIYKYDTTPPVRPVTISVDPPSLTKTNSFTFTWSGASDTGSGIKEYCYKTDEVTEVGGVEETCTTESVVSGTFAYQTGTNIFMVRTKDVAGNYSVDYREKEFQFSSEAPSYPLNLHLTYPTSGTHNDSNLFAFEWDAPTTFSGNPEGLRYFYSINALPNASNIHPDSGLENTYHGTEGSPIEPSSSSGENTFYVVAQDEAGNIDYNMYAQVKYYYHAQAPGVPRSLDLADSSSKTDQSWKVAITWLAPTSLGSGTPVYQVYRSDTATDCTSNMTAFTKKTEVSDGGTATVDIIGTGTALQKTYYYCVKACDPTGNECSGPSDTEFMYPDGKWEDAPTLTANPTSVVKTKSATITWSTSRTATSFVKYGTSSGSYGEEVGSSEHVTSHEIDLTGLNPGTTYYYKVLWTDEDGNLGTSSEYTLVTNAAPFVSEVKVTDRSLYSSYISFKIKNATKYNVQYGKTLSYGGSLTSSVGLSESTQTVKLDNLTEGTIYHLRVVAEDEEANTFAGDDYTFETLPVPKILNLKIQQVAGMPTATLRLLWTSNTLVTSLVTYYPKGNSESAKDQVNMTLKKSHEVILKDLKDDANYMILVKGKDTAGNEASFAPQEVKTAVDFRPPEIQNMNIESSIAGIGDEAKGQIVVSWDTDEPSTTQVEYAQGTGSAYGQSTQEDTNPTSNHIVTITGLSPSRIYHLRALSKDKNNNIGQSPDTVVTTPKSTKDALNLVIDNLSKTFGFLKDMQLSQ